MIEVILTSMEKLVFNSLLNGKPLLQDGKMIMKVLIKLNLSSQLLDE